MTFTYQERREKWSKSAKRHSLSLALGDLPSAEQEHVVSNCLVRKAAYTVTHTDG